MTPGNGNGNPIPTSNLSPLSKLEITGAGPSESTYSRPTVRPSLDGVYNSDMPSNFFAEMKSYVGFTADDARLLADLKEPLKPHFQEIVAHFYDVLLASDRARAVLHATTSRVEGLRRSLIKWIEELFGGVYEAGYFEQRARIGRTHVRVRLPQSFMFTAMNVIRLDLTDRILAMRLPELTKRVAAVHKILDLELAIMNETYSDDLIAQMREMEQRVFEQKLSESAHLATIGQLAASLAHEIKNPLAGISGAIQVLGSSLDDDHPHREVIGEVLRQIDRLDSAVKDLLIYARPKPPDRTRVNLSRTVDRVLLLVREEPAFQKVRLICRGNDIEHIAEVDEMQIHQVVFNLMLNAAHACENGGTVVCSVQNQRDRERITVEDDGIGIPKSILSRVFEPFFTTKAKGTGLGLPICQRIVDLHGGTLQVESEVGRGTRVTIEIPKEP